MHGSPARKRPPRRAPFRIAAVQERWHPDPGEHEAALEAGIGSPRRRGRRAGVPSGAHAAVATSPSIRAGRRRRASSQRICPAARATASPRAWRAETGVHVHASLYERAEAGDGLGYNTAIVVSPGGELVARTRKLHIPVTAGYHEDRYFRPGPGGGEPSPCSRSERRISVCRHAGTSGFRRSHARTASRARTCSSTRPRSARSRSIRISIPSRCGSR